MASPDRSQHAAPSLPDELRGLTYDQATPEQVAQVRAYMRAKLAAADARWTDEEREQQRIAFLRRLDAA
jgi:mono/diheme cytochrome c family protein